jgi:hypothetical protein
VAHRSDPSITSKPSAQAGAGRTRAGTRTSGSGRPSGGWRTTWPSAGPGPLRQAACRGAGRQAGHQAQPVGRGGRRGGHAVPDLHFAGPPAPMAGPTCWRWPCRGRAPPCRRSTLEQDRTEAEELDDFTMNLRTKLEIFVNRSVFRIFVFVYLYLYLPGQAGRRPGGGERHRGRNPHSLARLWCEGRTLCPAV